MIRSLISVAVVSSLYGQWAKAADRPSVGLPPQWVIPQSIPALGGRSQAVFGASAGMPIGRLHIRAVASGKAGPLARRSGMFAPEEERHGGERELVVEAVNVTLPRPPRGAPLRFEAVNYIAASDMGLGTTCRS